MWSLIAEICDIIQYWACNCRWALHPSHQLQGRQAAQHTQEYLYTRAQTAVIQHHQGILQTLIATGELRNTRCMYINKSHVAQAWIYDASWRTLTAFMCNDKPYVVLSVPAENACMNYRVHPCTPARA